MATLRLILQNVPKNRQLTYCVFSTMKERLWFLDRKEVVLLCHHKWKSHISQDVTTSQEKEQRSNDTSQHALAKAPQKQRFYVSKMERKGDFKKLHNRDLSQMTEEENMPDIHSFDESDQFGTLGSQPNAARRFETKNSEMKQFTVLHGQNKYWTENFGSLAKESDEPQDIPYESEDFTDTEDKSTAEDHVKPHWRLQKSGRFPQSWYSKQIMQFGKEGKIKEAIDVLEVWMLERDRVLPNEVCFDSLLGVLGRVGYTKKAFQVYNQMLKRGLTPTDYSYTSLFNACSNSPYPETDGLTRAKNLWTKMKQKGVQPNSLTVKAMIKAFGRGGDIETAFLLADNAIRHHRLDPEIYSFLLMAAISNKEHGLQYAIGIWRLMRKNGCKPDINSYNLLLRSVRECGIENEESLKQLLSSTSAIPNNQRQILPALERENLLPSTNDVDVNKKNKTDSVTNTGCTPIITAGSAKKIDEDKITSRNTSMTGQSEDTTKPKLQWWEIVIKEENKLGVVESLIPLSLYSPEESVPDILDPSLTLSHVISISDLHSTTNKLALFGGVRDFLVRMKRDHVSPDIKTFGQLMDLSPADSGAEMALLQIMYDSEVQPDIEIFNLLLRRRVGRRDYRSANEVIPLMTDFDVFPDQKTFGILAMTCTSQLYGFQILREMQDYGLMPDVKMMTALISNSDINFRYKKKLLKKMESLDIKPNKYLLEVIEKSLVQGRNYLHEQETMLKENSKTYQREIQKFEKDYSDFKTFYTSWLRRSELEPEDHPWSSFRHSDEDKHEV